MLTRHSPDREANRDVRELPPRAREGNRAWIQRAGLRDGVILLGGASLVEFRIRVAQSRVRRDMLPSFWSMAGILQGDRTVHTVADVRDLNEVPAHNGVQACSLAEFDDPELYPNVAVLQFTDDHAAVRSAVDSIEEQRSLVDIPELIVTWIAYVWGAGGQTNPLLAGQGLPSAALVEAAHALAGIDITPGLASRVSCPEAIWQAACWWTSYYDASAKEVSAGRARAVRPQGRWTTRQGEATAYEFE